MSAQRRLQLLGSYLASTPRLRLEFSLRLADGRLRSRSAPLFWVGTAHRDSRADFARLQRLLRAFECPDALLDCHLAHSPASLYQGVAIDLDATRVRGHLFMHCRDGTRERRLGLGWDGQKLEVTEYRAGLLTHAGDRDWLLHHVHRDYDGLLAALLREARLLGQGGYWVQRQQGQDTEIYLTYPWHPLLASLAPSLNAHLPAPLPQTWQRYRAAPIRHVGFSCRPGPAPAMTLYASAPYAGPWPLSLRELQERVMRSAAAESRRRPASQERSTADPPR
jgi:hypothetical protein